MGLGANIYDQIGEDKTYLELLKAEVTQALEKGGRRATIGEIREYNGVKMQKTNNGWVAVKEGSGGGKKEESDLGDSSSKVNELQSKLDSGIKEVLDKKKELSEKYGGLTKIPKDVYEKEVESKSNANDNLRTEIKKLKTGNSNAKHSTDGDAGKNTGKRGMPGAQDKGNVSIKE